jgi:hypothetical protein
VHNTYGERPAYVLRPSADGRAEFAKEFYVSPFYPVDGSYVMSLPEPGDMSAGQIRIARPPSPPTTPARTRGAGARPELRPSSTTIHSGVVARMSEVIPDGTDSSAGLSKKNAAMRRLLSTDIAVHVISYAQMEAVDIEPRTKALSKTPPPQAMPPEIKAQLPNGARDMATAPKIGPTINLDRALLKKMKERKADLETSEEMLEALAVNTNGTLIVPETLDEMVAKTATVAKMIDSSYVLTYIPKVPFVEKGGERNIDATSKRGGLVVQAKRKCIVSQRRGYDFSLQLEYISKRRGFLL